MPTVVRMQIAATRPGSPLNLRRIQGPNDARAGDRKATSIQRYGRALLALSRSDLNRARENIEAVVASAPRWVAARLLARAIQRRAGLAGAALPSTLDNSDHQAVLRSRAGDEGPAAKPSNRALRLLKGSADPRSALVRFWVFRDRDWTAHADAAIAEALRLAPAACAVAEAALQYQWARLKFNRKLAPESVLPARCLNLRNNKKVVARFLAEQGRIDNALGLLPDLALERVKWLERVGRGGAALSLSRRRADSPSNPMDEEFRLGDVSAAQGKLLLAQRAWRHASTLKRGDMGRRLQMAMLGAGKPWQSFRPDAAAIRAGAIPPELIQGRAALLLLDHHSSIRFHDGGVLNHVHQIVRILAPQAVEKFGEGHVPDGAHILRVATLKPDGRVLEPEDIVQKDSLSFAQVAVGDDLELEYVFTERGETELGGAWIEDPFYFRVLDIPTWHAQYVVLLQDGLKGSWDDRGRGLSPEAVKIKGFSGWRWVHKAQPAGRTEPLTPSPLSRLLRIQTWSGLDWSGVAARFRESMMDLLAADFSMMRLVARLAPRDGDRAKGAVALFEYVRDKIQENEGAFFDVPAWRALATGSGERAVTLLALLHAAGIKADMALVDPVHRSHPAQAVPDLRDFSYLLIRVALGSGKTLWLDPTFQSAPAGLIPATVRGRPAWLISRAGVSGPITIPGTSQAPDFRRINIQLRLAADGHVTGTWRERSSGMEAVSFREALRHMKPAMRERGLGNLVQSALPGATVQRVAARGINLPNVPLEIDMDFEMKGTPAMKSLILGLTPTFLSRRYVHLKARRLPLYAERFEALELTVEVTLAESLKWRGDPPAAVVANTIYGRYLRRAERSARSLKIIRRLNINPQVIQPADYAKFSQFCRLVDDADRLDLRFSGVP
jgi:hypothetical protein